MIKPILILLSLLFHYSLFAQETVRKSKYLRNGDKEQYYVLKEDSKTLHGDYERKGQGGHIIGAYKNGLKDGTWIEYGMRNRLRSRGAYKADQRVGFWKFYNWEGELEQEYDYTTRQLHYDLLEAGMKERKFTVIRGGDTSSLFLDRPPLYITGKTRMQSALMRGSTISLLLRLTRASGNVIIGFTIDTTGKASNFKVLKGIQEACDAEALRMVKQLPANWLPAVVDGQFVEVEHTITIAFTNN